MAVYHRHELKSDLDTLHHDMVVLLVGVAIVIGIESVILWGVLKEVLP